MKIKNQIGQYKECVEKAKEIWSRGNWDIKKDIPYLPSSNNHDVVLICLNRLYWTGKVPHEIHKSRGYEWILDGMFSFKVINSFDHRNGVIELC